VQGDRGRERRFEGEGEGNQEAGKWTNHISGKFEGQMDVCWFIACDCYLSLFTLSPALSFNSHSYSVHLENAS